MLKSTIKNIINEIEVSKEILENENITFDKACEYLELTKLEKDFTKYLENIDKKEEKEEEKND